LSHQVKFRISKYINLLTKSQNKDGIEKLIIRDWRILRGSSLPARPEYHPGPPPTPFRAIQLTYHSKSSPRISTKRGGAGPSSF